MSVLPAATPGREPPRREVPDGTLVDARSDHAEATVRGTEPTDGASGSRPAGTVRRRAGVVVLALAVALVIGVPLVVMLRLAVAGESPLGWLVLGLLLFLGLGPALAWLRRADDP